MTYTPDNPMDSLITGGQHETADTSEVHMSPEEAASIAGPLAAREAMDADLERVVLVEPFKEELRPIVSEASSKKLVKGRVRNTSIPIESPKPRRKEDRDYEDLLRTYLEDARAYPLLSPEDEVRLAQQIEAGNAAKDEFYNREVNLTPSRRRKLRREIRAGDEANRTFVNSNVRLVVSIAKKYQTSGMPLLDIIQEGNLGMMHAVDKFDWRKGFKFSTYATWWIRQAITRGIANTNKTIRLPIHVGEIIPKVIKTRSLLELRLGRPATLAEVADEMELPVDKILTALRYEDEPISLDAPLQEDGNADLSDVTADPNAISTLEAAIRSVLPDEVQKVLNVLEERERLVLSLRFGLDGGGERTLGEVGEYFNLTRERIRQIEARAMAKLRHPSADTGARELLNSF
ncbi:MAG TPA: sigma-70 family RNA polymerase sigma factor [Patescibacteria group bacterium]|nr:sigma-70 family RNA polymerase sigma factor [Patescibacteria group bacterium]